MHLCFFHMKRIIPILLFGLVLSVKTILAQPVQLSDKAAISVLTCAAGTQLYYAFGHTAFRVKDPVQRIDVVYNYGTFDFNKPNFYLNFVKGKLVYSLSRRSFDAFLYEYDLEKRWVKEQILNLNPQEVNQLFTFFEDNYKPENRDYLYDPLFNNCSSITGDILKKQFGSRIVFGDAHIEQKETFRQLVREFIPINSWGAFGIDLAFGGITDQYANAREQMFLPYYAMEQLKHTTKDSKPLVLRERTILNYPEQDWHGTFITTPFFWFSILLILVSCITYLDFKHKTRSKLTDAFLFFLSGLCGLFLILLWLATDHEVTKYNLNFLWLLPFNLYVVFYLLKAKKLPKWISIYCYVALTLLGLALILWLFGIQVLSPISTLPILTLAIRYTYLSQFRKITAA